MASSKETYCLCGQPYNIGQFMIECDCCREWFHGSCVDVKIYHSDDIDKYHCPKCSQTYGPSVLKIPTNNHRADRYELSAETRPSQVGSPAWVRALAARPPRPAPHAATTMNPHHFTEEFVRDNGFTKPVIFNTTDGLDMKTPNPATFTVRSVLRFCGAQLEVEVIDVRKQSTLRMPLIDFVDYFETPPEHRDEKVLNVLSLEFSDTNMSGLVEPPGVVRRLDWAECAWPAAEERPPRPAVQKYCLMSAAGSYTDFHVDFGGTTVWYHVLHGCKIFYLIPPTSTNLALYQQWSASNNHTERFFGDMVEWYGTVELCAGQTLFIPTGWVHAVLTPVDSLVFGGNLLHSYAIEMQLQIYEIERRVETPTAFRYPLFEAMHWYAGAFLLTMLRRHNEETQDEDFTLSDYSVQAAPQQIAPLLLRGIKILANALKEWHALKSTDAAKRDNVPKCLNSGQLVRELCKELRTLEKRANTNKDKDLKVKHPSPKKSHSRAPPAKKSLKLTLPRPIMHMQHNGERDYGEEKVYADKFYIDNKEVVYHENRYVEDTKYMVEMGSRKEVVYQGYPEPQGYPTPPPPYTDTPKKALLRIKLNSSPEACVEQPPPPYPDSHSILKSHLTRGGGAGGAGGRALKPAHQWTISKREGGDADQHLLYTNDTPQQQLDYGPGMYSAEDIQQEYQYTETKGAYQPDYGYQSGTDVPYDTYQRYEMQPPHAALAQAGGESVGVVGVEGGYSAPVLAEGGAGAGGELNGAYSLPAYDAAIAHHYADANTTHNYVIEEEKPSPLPVRRSVRPVRRRVSNTYDYEDGDLFIDDTPAPRRRPKPAKHKQAYRHTASNGAASGPYRQPAARPPPAHPALPPAHPPALAPALAPAPANGIESLIQASVLADGDAPGNDTEDAAVAGMLSISERFSAGARTFGLPATHATHADRRDADDAPDSEASGTGGVGGARVGAGAGGRGRRGAVRTPVSADERSDDDVIKEVHRDDEYVYPSLEMSSDEDEEWTASRRRNPRSRHDSRSKSDKDESWSPRARLGRLVPRLRGPARNVRRECVRAALHAASTRAPPPHPHPHPPAHAHAHHERAERERRDPHAPRHAAQNAKRAVLASKSRRPPPPAPAAASSKNQRLKKGMKTAKQRLGKILKIHKMIH